MSSTSSQSSASVDATLSFDEDDVKFSSGGNSYGSEVSSTLTAKLVEPLRKFDGQTERTLLLVKPEAIKYLVPIEVRLKKEGFFVLQRRRVHLTPEQASELFASECGSVYFPRLVAYASSAPVVALCLTKTDAIAQLKKLLGPPDVKEARLLYPRCMRAIFGQPNDNLRNALQASDSEEMAEFEIHFFFPNMVLEPMLSGEHMMDYLAYHITPTLTSGLTEVCKEKPVDPVVWLANWLLINNPYKPDQDENIATLKT